MVKKRRGGATQRITKRRQVAAVTDDTDQTNVDEAIEHKEDDAGISAVAVRATLTVREQSCCRAWLNRPRSVRQVILQCYDMSPTAVTTFRYAQTLHLQQEIVGPIGAPFINGAYLTDRRSIEVELTHILGNVRLISYLLASDAEPEENENDRADEHWYMLKYDIDWLPVNRQTSPPLGEVFTITVQYDRSVSVPLQIPPQPHTAQQSVNRTTSTTSTRSTSSASQQRLKTVAQVIARYTKYCKDVEEYSEQSGAAPPILQRKNLFGISHTTHKKDKYIHDTVATNGGIDDRKWKTMSLNDFREEYGDAAAEEDEDVEEEVERE
jgi:hypothetical protein